MNESICICIYDLYFLFGHFLRPDGIESCLNVFIPRNFNSYFYLTTIFCPMALETSDFVLVNAFTSAPFGGNPAAVLFLKTPLADYGTYLKIAQNFSQPMACFVLPPDEGQEPDEVTRSYNIRWFTVNKETSMCGHGTLAAAYALFRYRKLPSNIETLRFKTIDGVYVYARRVLKDGCPLRIQIELPQYGLDPLSGDAFREIQSITSKALRIPNVGIKYVGRGSKTAVGADRYLLIELDENVDLEGANVDTSVFAGTIPCTTNILTVRSKRPNVVYEYRMFAPLAGVPEDHVCGSANCTMAPYWAEKLGLSKSDDVDGPREMYVKAVSERSGDLWINVDNVKHVVLLQGEACLFGEGIIYL